MKEAMLLLWTLFLGVYVAADPRRDSSASNCQDEADPGPCWAYVESWYYNTRERRCMKFVYGGCQGNGNRYETEEECRRKCGGGGGGGRIIPDVRTDICDLPAERGNCRASLPRYFFNRRTGQCEKFVYGGCGGNANNFETLQACRANCGGDSTRIPDIGTGTCDLPAERGDCRASITRYYFNRRTGQCEKFIYGGCGGNSNNFETMQACRANCAQGGGGGGGVSGTCSLPAEMGECKGSLARYYFNRRTGQCEKFVYGGCGGNGNNFETLKDCQRTCGGGGRISDKEDKVVKKDVCSLPVELGNCRGSLPRFYFDRITGRCQKFFYGGCGGNENNFESQLECQRTCGASRRS